MEIDIKKDLKKYIALFREAYDQEMNESATSLKVSKFCEDVLGYDVLQEISLEYRIKHRYVDYAIKVDDKVQFFIEVKQASLALKERHIEQASNYAANAGVSWILLTNGKNWNIYHLTFDEGIQISLVWSIDLLEGDIKESISKLSMLHKKNIRKGMLKDYYNKKQILSPKKIIQAIFHENILHLICLHLKKTSGMKIDVEELAESIRDMISKETWELIGDIKIIKKTQKKEDEKVKGKTKEKVKTTGKEETKGHKVVLAPYAKEGFEICLIYKNKRYEANVRKDGTILCEGKVYNSPSGASSAIISRQSDGWKMWKYERAPGDWVILDVLRNK